MYRKYYILSMYYSRNFSNFPKIKCSSYGLNRKSFKSTKLFSAKCNHHHIENFKYHGNLFYSLQENTKSFHTSRVRNINPVAVIVLRQISKVTAIIVGRGFRKWWKSLPKDKRHLFSTHIIKNKWRYLVSLFLFGGTTFYLYDSHLCLTPYTERKRFMIFDSAQISKISEFHFQMDEELLKERFLSSTNPHVVRTKRICEKLLRGNRDLPQIYTKFWTVSVVDSKEENCHVYPTGQIVMYNGMLELTDNDDQIAIVLAHEISHVILEHTAELFNYGTLIDILIVVPLALIWAFLPNDGVAMVAHWFFKRVVNTLVQLPYSRKLEKEADEVGLFLAASACFDVREASAFWGRLDLLEKFRSRQKDNKEMPEVAFLNTHPSHSERQCHIDQLMSSALKTREDRKCPNLNKLDPRHSVRTLQQQFDAVSAQR